MGPEKPKAEYAICDLDKNTCYRYAALRNILYAKGKKIEVLSSFYPNVFYVAEWFKQLFGESEGKQGKGIFPASLDHVHGSSFHGPMDAGGRAHGI